MKTIRAGDIFGNITIDAELPPVDFGRTRIRRFKCRCVCGAKSKIFATNLGHSNYCRKCRPHPPRPDQRKLHEIEVENIRAMAGVLSHDTMAGMFGVHPRTISNVVRRVYYRDVGDK